MTTKTTSFLAGLVAIALGLGCDQDEKPTPYQPMPLIHDSAVEVNAPKSPPARPGENRGAILNAIYEPDVIERASQLARLLPSLGPEAVPEVKEVLANYWHYLQPIDTILLVSFWAKYEPAEAVQWAAFKAPRHYRNLLVEPALRAWAKLDPAAAARQVKRLEKEKGELSFFARDGLVVGWFESGKPGLADYIRSVENRIIGQTRALTTLMRRTLQRHGPDSITRWAEEIASSSEDAQFSATVAEHLEREIAHWDPAWAAEVNPLSRIPQPGGKQYDILAAVYEADSAKRVERIVGLLAGFGKEELPDVQALLANFWLDLQPIETILLISHWGRFDPPGAARWAAFKAPAPYKEILVRPAMRAWAKLDPYVAAEQAGVMMTGAGAIPNLVRDGLILGWFESGKPGLEDYIRLMGEGTIDQQMILTTLIRGVVKRYGPETITRWAEAIPVPTQDKRFKLAAYRRVARELTLWDPASAVAWCDAQCDGPYGADMRSVISHRWVWLDPMQTVEWLKGSEPGPERDLAVREMFQSWSARDLDELLQWVDETMGEVYPEWFNPALIHLSTRLCPSDFQTGMKVAEQVDEPNAKRISMQNCARRWYAQRPEVVEAWLDKDLLEERYQETVRRSATAKTKTQRNKN